MTPLAKGKLVRSVRWFPLVSNLLELDGAPRRFLFFCFFNVVSWQCIAGAVLVLFAREIGMPVSWVGFLQSFMPLSTLLAAFTVPLVTYLGPKRLMSRTWLSRNLAACLVFLMPWAVTKWGAHAGWYVLMIATMGFCLTRALGVAGWFPWLHEVVPDRQRGIYFSAEAAVTHLINIGVLFLQGLILSHNPGIGRFLVIYGIGVAAGLASLVWMYRVPGGLGVKGAATPHGSETSYGAVLRDRQFLRFVVTASLCFSIFSWYGSSIVLYMRDAIRLEPNRILFITTAGSLAILLTIRAWGRFAESRGSGPAMFKTLSAHSLAALFCLTLVPGTRWAALALAPTVVLCSIFGAAFWVATHRALLNHVKESGRAAYTSIWIVGTALASGFTPIVVGFIIEHGNLWGFRACFAVSGLAGLCGAWACQSVVRDGPPVIQSPAELLRPAIPLRTLARIVWITVGLHPSNRQTTRRTW